MKIGSRFVVVKPSWSSIIGKTYISNYITSSFGGPRVGFRHPELGITFIRQSRVICIDHLSDDEIKIIQQNARDGAYDE